MDVLTLLSLFVRALFYGGFLSLAACGLSLGFQLGFINAAHGDIAVLAAYFAWILLQTFGMDPLFSLIPVTLTIIAIGVVFQKFILNRFLSIGASEALLIVTFALGMNIRNILQLIFAADLRGLTLPYMLGAVRLGVFTIPYTYLIDFFAALFIFAILHLFFKKTFAGKSLRAVAQDREAAMALGVNPDRASIFAMVIMALTQAVFGVLMGITYTFSPNSGPSYLLLPFGAIMLAGLGSLKKTFIGGLIMGEMILLSEYLIGSQFQMVSCYIVVLIILLFKPEGLLTRRY
jgi:branched-chain amino acid transport system permease protein